jgi:hypothetical protein
MSVVYATVQYCFDTFSLALGCITFVTQVVALLPQILNRRSRDLRVYDQLTSFILLRS